ncbi:hypothetical protein BH20ACT24_BH20ACT24_10060 [soil metagenome]
MSGLDDRLRRDLERLAESQEAGRGVFGRVQAKKARRRWIRRTQVAGLVVAVVSGTAAGTYGLSRVFDGAGTSTLGRTAPLPHNGLIAFARDGRLYAMEPDGTGVQLIPRAEGSGGSKFPAWSPEGRRIAFVTDDADGGNQRVEVVEVATGETLAALAPERTSEVRFVEYSRPSWSPDGMWLAFSAVQVPTRSCGQFACRGTRSYVFSGRADGGVVVQLTDGDVMDFFPTWSPDATTIAFTRAPAGVGGSASGAADGRTLQLMNVDGSKVRAVRTSLETPAQLTWSPDGEGIAVVDSYGDLSVVQVQGGSVRRLVDAKAHFVGVSDVGWSPDGKSIVYSQLEEAGGAVYVVSAEGGRPERLVEGCCPSWQPLPIGASGIAPTPTPRFSASGGTSTPSPTPTVVATTPSPSPTWAPGCDASRVEGDFDADGNVDVATVARTECLVPSPEANSPYDTPFTLDVDFGPGGVLWRLPECSTVCAAQAAADIDGTGIDELVLRVDGDASRWFLQVYAVPFGSADVVPVPVAAPGAPGHAPDEPATFPVGASGTPILRLDDMQCTVDEEGGLVTAYSALLKQDRSEYAGAETAFRLRSDSDNYGYPVATVFEVVSTREFTYPFEAGVTPEFFGAGETCSWAWLTLD